MPLVTWTADLSVGIPELDDQHQKMVEIINKLYDAIVEFRGQSAIAETLESLVTYTKEHFSYEEECMLQCTFAGFPHHKRVHENFTQKVMDLRRKAQEADFVMSVEILEILRDWLVNHIQDLDQQYATCIRRIKTS